MSEMTDILKEARRRLNEATTKTNGSFPWETPELTRENAGPLEAMCALLEEMAALRQQVSDTILEYFDGGLPEDAVGFFHPFIIGEPDPLVEALKATGDDEAEERAWRLRAQLASLGYEVGKKPSCATPITLDNERKNYDRRQLRA
ncbi:hypothetical protein ACQKOE_07430 [Novosphingobium sp. NPDC080210]|uniref:hypothetical protein n=1 Tax=Novosphingobium sp. NPDC080210 TaxID=3390596 RepID=UPI003CFD42CE